MPKRHWAIGVGVGVGVSSLLAACSSSPPAPKPLAACTATSGGQINLGVAAYTAVDPTQTAGCAVFPANGSTSAGVEYLVIAQSASNTQDDSEPFKLGGSALASPGLAATGPVPTQSVAQQFDLRLRLTERALVEAAPRPLRAPPRVPAAITPVDSGNVRTFKVCNSLSCDPRQPSTLSSVTATALKVGTHIAIYVDNAAPAPGVTQAELDSLRSVFDTRLYETDTLAFGRESDIDQNGMVIVLMTGKVNSLVTASQCTSTGFVAGFFFGADLITTAPFASGNNGEIFYSIVPDPSGSLSCAHSVTTVMELVPVTFVHEFQHMISFNQHVLKSNLLSPPEELWLNEGLSHYAEENGGRTFLPDTATFCRYVVGDVYNSGLYFGAPQNFFVVDSAGIGGLANRGAYWLFVRYLVDQLAPTAGSANAVTRQLDGTFLTGAANVSNVAGGTPFATIVQRWGLANYVSDLPGFTAPPELEYATWKFRSDYQTIRTSCAPFVNTSSLPSQLPLLPPTLAGSAAQVSGVLRAGSGDYYLMQQAPSAPSFTLLFSNSAGAALRTTIVPQLAILRLQ